VKAFPRVIQARFLPGNELMGQMKPVIWLIRSRAGALVLAGVVAALSLYSVLHMSTVGKARAESTAPAANLEPMQNSANPDFSKFLHSNQNHARLPCLLCHRRETNSATPSLPGGSGHLPCAGCHAALFAGAPGPICNICHTDVKSGALKPFPRLQSFRMKFDHARHLNMGSVGCATCHRSARGGVALSIPKGFNAHTTCFRCHTGTAKSGDRDISSCGTCHELGGYARTSESAPAFRVGFNHAKHKEVTCKECHQVRAGMPQRRQVTSPQPFNHHASGKTKSCLTCHDGKRAFGGDDFTACKRCHTGAAWRF
jgi:c(7)-type cytochrome triheme protein